MTPHDPNPHLARLRAALAAPTPTVCAWRDACDALDHLDGDALRVGLDYADAALSAWPDALRVAPRRWACDGTTDPRFLLARAWVWSPAWADLTALDRADHLRVARLIDAPVDTAQNWIDNGNLSHVHTLDLSGCGEEAWGGYNPIVDLIGWTRPNDALKTLILRRCAFGGDDTHALFYGQDGLHTLDLSRNPLGSDGGISTPVFAATTTLRALRLSGCGLTAADLDALMQPDILPRLTRLDLSANPNLGADLDRLQAAASTPRARTLQHLDLRGCDLSADALRRLRPLWPALGGPQLLELAAQARALPLLLPHAPPRDLALGAVLAAWRSAALHNSDRVWDQGTFPALANALHHPPPESPHAAATLYALLAAPLNHALAHFNTDLWGGCPLDDAHRELDAARACVAPLSDAVLDLFDRSDGLTGRPALGWIALTPDRLDRLTALTRAPAQPARLGAIHALATCAERLARAPDPALHPALARARAALLDASASASDPLTRSALRLALTRWPTPEPPP